MRFFKKLTDWKTWLFTILPIILLVIWLAVMIYAHEKSPHNATLIISALLLFQIVIILMSAYPIYLKIMQKNYIRAAVALALILLFLGLQLVLMIMLPKLNEASQIEQNAYQILLDTPFDDVARSERLDAWEAANEKAHNLNLTMSLLFIGSMIAVVIVEILCRSHNSNEENDESGVDIQI